MFGFIQVAEHVKNGITNGKKKAVQKRTVFEKKDSKFFGNGENAMTMSRAN